MRTTLTRRIATVVATFAAAAGLMTGIAGVTTTTASASTGQSISAASTGNAVTGTTVGAGEGVACAIRTGGTLACWGPEASFSRLNTVPSGQYVQLSVGTADLDGGTACAVSVNGTVTCWGDNSQIVNATPAGTFSSVSVGAQYACGITSSGTLDCWGQTFEVPPTENTTFRSVSVGDDNGCAIGTDGTLTCWGDASGIGTDSYPTPTGAFTSVSVDDEGACAVGTDSTVTCFGANVQAAPAGDTFRQVAVGGNSECGIETDGVTECWGPVTDGLAPPAGTQLLQLIIGGEALCGLEASGQIGCWGNEGDTPNPVPDFNFGHPSIAAGDYDACAIRTDSSVTCTYYTVPAGLTAVQIAANYYTYCALGFDGTATCAGITGGAAPSGTTFSQVVAGDHWGCGIQTGGTLSCWGSAPPTIPVNIQDTQFTQIAAGDYSVCGIEADGNATCFGYVNSESTPTGMFRQITVGAYAACGIQADETAKCWGGDNVTGTEPVGVSFRQISLEQSTACGVTTSAAVQCWGSDANKVISDAPAATDFISVGLGVSSACGLHVDGTTSCWGTGGDFDPGDLIVPPNPQTITFTSTTPTSPTVGGTAYSASAKGGASGNAVVLSIDKTSGNDCSINHSNLVTFQHAGDCMIDADQAGDGVDYADAATVSQDLTVGKGTQAIDFTSTPPTSPAFGDHYTPAATGGGSGNPVTFTLDGDSGAVCSYNESTGRFTFNHAGDCVIDANQAGDSDYTAAPQQQESITVDKAAQAIRFTDSASLPTDPAIGDFFTPTAKGGESSNPVVLTVDPSSNTVCTMHNDDTVGLDHAGTCTIDANQDGGRDYTAAPQIQQSVVVGKTAQKVSFLNDLPSSEQVGGSVIAHASGGGSENPVVFSIDGSSGDACTISDADVVSFDHVGTCTVDATQAGDHDYAAGSAQLSETVVVAPQVITFTTPIPTHKVVGGTYTPVATGGGSGNPVVFTIDGADAPCTISNSGVVTFTGAGTCTIDANQDGTDDYAAATEAQQLVVAALVPSHVMLSLTPTEGTYGAPFTATATVSTRTGSPVGEVQFYVDGSPSGNPVKVLNGMAATHLVGFANRPLLHGSHSVEADYIPYDPTTYAGSRDDVDTVVNQMGTTTTLTLHAHTIVATVTPSTPLVPGAATPTGLVTFLYDGDERIGVAPLVNGIATLDATLTGKRLTTVSAQYSGDKQFLSSGISASRRNPIIKATVTSAHPQTSYGWYNGPVTVSFTCKANGSPLTSAGCPSPVTLSASGAGRTVTRSVHAVDGGLGMVTARHINIDRNAPKLRIGGVSDHAKYGGEAPKARCVATDALSGVASCTVHLTAVGKHRTNYTLVAKDKAGNVTTASGSYRVTPYYFDGLTYAHGAYTVRAGHTYDLIALTSHGAKPRYYDAAPAPEKAFQRDGRLKRAGRASGRKRWAIGIAIDHGMLAHTYWNVGVKVAGTLHTIRLRVIK